MDVNGTHFHLLLGYKDWGNCCLQENGERPVNTVWDALATIGNSGNTGNTSTTSTTSSVWNDEQGTLTLQPHLYWLADTDDTSSFQWNDRRGAARDHAGNWYWIDQSRGEILFCPPDVANPLHFWSSDNGIAYATAASSSDAVSQREEQTSPPASLLAGLTITDDSYLVVGVLEPAGLLIFNLFDATLPVQLLWPPEVPFVSFDMAPRQDGGVWILDRENARYWGLNRNFHVLRRDQPELLLLSEQIEIFQAVNMDIMWSVNVEKFPEGFALFTESSDADIPRSAMAIEALPDGTVLVLTDTPNEPFASIYRYRLHRQQGEPVSAKVMSLLIEQEQLAAFTLRGYDFAFVPAHNDREQNAQPDRLYIITPEGRQVYAFTIWQRHNQLMLHPLSGFYPVYSFEGKALSVAENELFYDAENSWLPLLEQPRLRYSTCATLYTPTGITRPALDGSLPGCVWHRLLVDASMPPETTVQIWSRTSDTEEDLIENDWRREPNFYLRDDGSELPFVAEPEGTYQGTWELLFQAARGRYLQLKIMLSGNGGATPSIHAMRVYYPRFSYLEHYLPAVYSQNSHSASFLDRFLANVEGFYTTLEDRIAAVQMLFDPRSTPAEALAWLASWFGTSLDIHWDVPRKRFFLRHAMEYFQWRGTLRGLQMILQLTFDIRPGGPLEDSFDTYLKNSMHVNGIRIIEKFCTRHAPGALFGDPTDPNGELLSAERWTPNRGGRVLIARYRQLLQEVEIDNNTLKTITTFPLSQPVGEHQKLAWMHITQDMLGFVPNSTHHPQRWQRFLQRRYITLAALNAAYQSNFATFEDVLPFQHVPPDGPPLQDWYEFETIVLATYNVAHQFTVLLPMPTTGNPQHHYQQLELAARIIEKEKPAHTVFDVKFYRAAFAIGAARLGIDTFVDTGSRTPDLIAPLILGESYISESYLTTGQLYALSHQGRARTGDTYE